MDTWHMRCCLVRIVMKWVCPHMGAESLTSATEHAPPCLHCAPGSSGDGNPPGAPGGASLVSLKVTSTTQSPVCLTHDSGLLPSQPHRAPSRVGPRHGNEVWGLRREASPLPSPPRLRQILCGHLCGFQLPFKSIFNTDYVLTGWHEGTLSR